MAELGCAHQSSEASGGRVEVLCPWECQEGGLIIARPVATGQSFPSVCPWSKLGECGDMGAELREKVGEVPGSCPTGGRGGGAGHQRVGKPTSRPQGQVAFVRAGLTHSGQWGVVFTFRPTGVTAEPGNSLLHDKGGTYEGSQAAPH